MIHSSTTCSATSLSFDNIHQVGGGKERRWTQMDHLGAQRGCVRRPLRAAAPQHPHEVRRQAHAPLGGGRGGRRLLCEDVGARLCHQRSFQ